MTCSNCNQAHAPHELRFGLCLDCLANHREGLMKECQMLREAIMVARDRIAVATDPELMEKLNRAVFSSDAYALFVRKEKVKPIVSCLENIATNYDHEEQTREHSLDYDGICRTCDAMKALQLCRELGL